MKNPALEELEMHDFEMPTYEMSVPKYNSKAHSLSNLI